LPEPVRGYVEAGAKAIGCDLMYVALPLLGILMSAIGNARRIQLKRGWTEPAILWVLVIAKSGTHKSPAFDLAKKLLMKRQMQAKKRFKKALQEYLVQKSHYDHEIKEWKKAQDGRPPPKEPEKPILERCFCDDTTVEAIAALLAENWRGLILAKDELSAWLGSFDCYKKSKGADAAKWIEMHGGRPMVIDRKTGEPKTLFIEFASVSIVGGIQPRVVQRILSQEHWEMGMVARFLLGLPNPRQREWSEMEVDPTLETAVINVMDNLFAMKPTVDDEGEAKPTLLRLTAQAKELFIQFFNAHAKDQMALGDDLAAAEVFSKVVF
jgi:Protein of unknown function (DUF3987)